MAMKVGGTDEFNSEINVTPMVDVMLVLLIIFMIVTPLLQQGVPVDLPRNMVSPEQDEEISKDTSLVITITDNSIFYVGKQDYPLERLGELIDNKMKDRTPDKKIVYIKADNNVRYDTVVKAIDVIRKQGVEKIGLVADKKKGQDGK